MGETQERERVLAHFSRRFRQCNPESLTSEGTSARPPVCPSFTCPSCLTCATLSLRQHPHSDLRRHVAEHRPARKRESPFKSSKSVGAEADGLTLFHLCILKQQLNANTAEQLVGY